MSAKRRQAVAAAAGVVVGAVVNVATGMLTQEWALAWLAATAAFVVTGAGLLAWLTYRATPDPDPARPDRVSASGDGAIAAGGSVKGSSTRVTRPPAGAPPSPGPETGQGVSASGLGAITAGDDVDDSHTQVTGEDPATP
ncbi:hypothetical protein E1287_07015 [Actinomadura sp. KC06]|uniref:hypothetical protein n=1 Tax=Actinomadura sp. KC06 TaxID=2530369 RepID=UPI00104FCAD7|nr:hypothetical protein [Actinomadura sp. KC06]TDD38041.1 hypothetical protein E1287_07015 [Actinomadura sp. KC06]